jgi:hypothetical protein
MIKEEISALINQGYLSRDLEDMNLLLYVA